MSVLDTPYYHCVCRCLRRAFLCGEDGYSGQSYDHRRDWFIERLATLNNVFNAGRLIGQEALQLHGGMGMADAINIGHYCKRRTAINALFGSRDHLERYARLSATQTTSA